jgi:hypothetical protein
MGLDTLNDAQLYMRSRRQCDDSLPKKNMSFCFNHPHNPDTGSRSQKVWKFKRFWSLWRPHEGTLGLMDKIYQSDQHGHLPEAENKNGVIAWSGYQS